jgi:Tfp pilus assembly protein PilV
LPTVGEGVGYGRPVVGAPCSVSELDVSELDHRRRRGGPLRQKADERGSSPPHRRDRGTTFVEVLVSIVLLGTVVGGTLTALRTSIISSDRGEGRANAQLWLQTARDVIYRTPYMDCTTPYSTVEVKNFYDAAVQAAAPPTGWAGGSVGVNIVQFWSKSDGHEVWGDACGTASAAQLVEIYVLSPTGDVGRTIQVIKAG